MPSPTAVAKRKADHGVAESSVSAKKSKTLQALKKNDVARRSSIQATAASNVAGDDPKKPTTKEQAAINSLITKGKEHFKQGSLDSSLKAFKTALLLCECNGLTIDEAKQRHTRGVASQPSFKTFCACKNFLAAAQQKSGEAIPESTPSTLPELLPDNNLRISELDLNAIYNLAQTRCHCGLGSPSCTSDAHLTALDGCAAVYESKCDLQQALKLGILMMDLAPANAEGYLRTAKVVRLSSSGEAGRASLLARCLYKHGISNVEKYGCPSSAIQPKVQALSRCYLQLSRRDLIYVLPYELKLLVFQGFSLRDLGRSRQVSRDWKGFIESSPPLWRYLEFNQGKGPSSRLFRTILTKFSQCKTTRLMISDCRSFGLSMQTLIMAVEKLPQLEHLELQSKASRAVNLTLPGPLHKELCLNLKYLALDHVMSTDTIGSFIKLAPNLEHLTVKGGLDVLPMLPALRNLRSLRLEIAQPFNNSTLRALSFPSLEHLYLEGYWFGHGFPNLTVDPDLIRNLKSLVLGPRTVAPSMTRQDGPLFPTLPSSMRMIDLLTPDSVLALNVLLSHHGPDNNSKFDRLEFLRCRGSLDPTVLLPIISPSIENGVLGTLELGAMMEAHPKHPVEVFTFPSNNSIHTLGLYDFIWYNSGSYHSMYTGKPFVDWVSQFDNVKTVAAYPERVEEAGEIILALVDRGIKTIYQNCLHGVMRDKVLQLAQKKGVEVIHTANDWRPVVFPWPAREEA